MAFVVVILWGQEKSFASFWHIGARSCLPFTNVLKLKMLCPRILRSLFSWGPFSPLLFPSVLLATFPQTRCSYFRSSDALGLRSSGCKNVPLSLPLLIAIYDEYDANMQNNLTVNTSPARSREEEGKSYSNACTEVNDLLRKSERATTFDFS